MHQLDVSSTATCDCREVDCQQVLNGGLHLDFGVLQRSKLVEIRKAQNETKKNNPL